MWRLICSESNVSWGPHCRNLKPTGGKRDKGRWCDVALQRASDIQQNIRSNEKKKRRGGGEAGGDDRGLGSVQELLTGQWKKEERQFQFVKSSGNNPDSVMDQSTDIHWPTQKQQNSIYH